jgi:hypothetical protein
MVQQKGTQLELIAEIETNQRVLQESRLSYEICCHRLSTCLHPFDIHQNRPQTTAIVSLELQYILQTLQNLRQTHQLKDPRNGIRALKNQIESLSAIVDLWWSWVAQCLAARGCELSTIDWVKRQLLPVVYWQQQVRRTKNPQARKNYQMAHQNAFFNFEQHPVTLSLSKLDRDDWWNWAMWMVSKFQRSSSAVEGRNSYLSQVYHNRRGLSAKRLKVATVIHNFYLKRSDGTTSAERLFSRKFPNLFEYLVKNIGELPQPRKPRKSSLSQTLIFSGVPS